MSLQTYPHKQLKQSLLSVAPVLLPRRSDRDGIRPAEIFRASCLFGFF